MSLLSFLLTLGAGLLGLLGYAVALVVGGAAFDEVKEVVFRRRSLAVRRQRNRGYLIAGYAVGVACVMLPAFVGIAVATNGRPEGPGDARWFFAVAGIGATVAVVLLAEWWRRSAKP